MVLIESGVTWLPGFLWRAIKTWRGVRAECPVGERIAGRNDPPPGATDRAADRRAARSEIARPDHQPDRPDDMLLFATDYPHWQFDGDEVLPPGLNPSLIRKMRYDNPRHLSPPRRRTPA